MAEGLTSVLAGGPDVLKTHVEQRDADVLTSLPRFCRQYSCRPWTAVWASDRSDLLWLRFYDGPVSAGGLAEAHEHVVAVVKNGVLPAKE